MRTGQPNTRTSCGAKAPLSHAFRLDPHAAFPDTRSRSLNIHSVSKKVPDRNPWGLRLHANTRCRHGDAGGSLRVFKQFAWLEAGSVTAAWSRPAHQCPEGV